MDSSEDQLFTTCEDCDLSFTSIKSFEQHVNGQKHKKEVKDKNRKPQVKSLDDDEDKSPEEEIDDHGEEHSCDICEMTFSGIIPYSQHLKSRRHSKALQRKKLDDDQTKFEDESDSEPHVNDDVDLNESVKQIMPEPYGSCFICEKQFTGPEGYVQHMRSESHTKRTFNLKMLKNIKSALRAHEDNDRDEICEEEAEKKLEDDEGQDLECKECGKAFTGAIGFAQHLTSKAHAKRQKHNKLLEELEVREALELFEDIWSSSEDQEQSDVLTCQICLKTFYSPENAKDHFKSKGHKKAVQRIKYLEKRNEASKQNSGISARLATKETS